MKTLHKFILKSYVGPFVMTFFIAMFVFFMMFIFTYIDDFVGKGIDASILARCFTSTEEVRDRDGSQEADNRNHDHDFNEREARFA